MIGLHFIRDFNATFTCYVYGLCDISHSTTTVLWTIHLTGTSVTVQERVLTHTTISTGVPTQSLVGIVSDISV